MSIVLRSFVILCGLAFGLAAHSARAQDSVVVVELFTSQGCSSCPPADALLRDLADREDVIALALHVDYWDYIGWKDEFASPAHTARQKAYAHAANKRSIYTPQIIVDGSDTIIGARAMDLAEAIQAHKQRNRAVSIALERSGDTVRVSADLDAGAVPRAMQVYLLRYIPHREVRILRGENAGHSFDYRNIVADWQRLADWNGTEPLRLDAVVAGDRPVVVLVQESGHGPILAAARLR